ncbi:MAG: hypothetical protein JWN32_3909 [Solirubrobacterales bacterium]|jgi:hypothetical protein|nr:hypothetical protein [Solirubrobacterales bacterium]
MTIGTSLVLVAVGAILHYAVTAHVSWIDLQTTGTVLMVVGIVGLVIGLVLAARGRWPTAPPPPV